MEKLKQILLNKINNNEDIGISDLYNYSSIKLKRSRNKKKFNKYYYRYINKNIYDLFLDKRIFQNCLKFTKTSLYLDLIPLNKPDAHKFF